MKNGLGPLFTDAENLAGAHVRCQTKIEGQRAARWQGAPRAARKTALDLYSGGLRTQALVRLAAIQEFYL